MAEKIKKKPFFSLRRLNHQSTDRSPSPSPGTPTTSNQDAYLFTSNSANIGTPRASINSEKPRKLSTGGIKELVQCPLCLEVLHNPKMLPCQHTFCTACLTVYIADLPIIDCPICKGRIQVTGRNFVSNLPSNLYIDSMLKIVGINSHIDGGEENKSTTPPQTPSATSQSVELQAGGVKCSHCQTICDRVDVKSCQHCKMNFCGLCWSQHLGDMRTQITAVLKQIDSASDRLQHKVEHYRDRCERIAEQIDICATKKINSILESKKNLLKEASDLQKSGGVTALALKISLDEAKSVATKAMTSTSDDEDQVTTFVNLHHNTLQLLSDVSKWDANHFVFDKENFCIEKEDATPVDAESDEPLSEGTRNNNPLESENTLALYYRSRNFIPHYVWRKTSRPCGVGIGPWDNNLYVCGMDSHCVLVVERSRAKIVARLTCDEMLCPVHIAFMKSTGEVYVTDKWKHCVHVFSKEGEYLRSFGQKGSRVGMFRSPEGIATDNAQNMLYVADTGNDRVQVLQPDGQFVNQIGVATKQQVSQAATVWETKEITCTELNAPTSVAVTNERVIVLDSGNRRVKIYNKQDKGKIIEFGALGQRKGQFRQPEVLTVDPMGFILVGDSGNCRVQVFKQNGQLVRIFGGLGSEPGKFGWISCIHVTRQLDIIVSDTKNHVVNFF